MKLLPLITAICYIVSIITISSCDTEVNSPVVTVDSGKLQGITQVSRNGNKYFAFLGVPYANVAIRFGAPQPLDKWTDTKKVTELPPPCFQFGLAESTHIGTEYTCLTLNIYSPSLSADAKLPVLVFYHGGGFQVGHGDIGNGKYIVDENAIMITVQYRLGALGFLNVGKDEPTVVPNAGMRDQNAALRWVQRNIDKFGGDKAKVTIFGFSAGGSSVHYHMLSPMSKGLFVRAISQSGTALNPWAFQQNPKKLAKQLAKKLKCPNEDVKEMVKCLRKKPATEIVNAQMKFSKFSPEFDMISMLFCPSVEEGDSEPKFLPDTPYNIVKNGKTASKVPWISGVDADEGAFYTALILENDTSLDIINSDWNKMAPNILYYENSANPALHDSISQKIWDFYFKKGKIGIETFLELGQVYGDRFFVTGVRRAILEHARKPDFPIYPYIFSYQGNHSIVQGFLHTEDAYGVAHADELKYLFHETAGAPAYITGKEAEFSRRLVKLLVSFAENGKPEMYGSVKTWEPYVNAGSSWGGDTPIPWLVIDENTKILEKDPFVKRTDFWESLPISEVQKEGRSFGKDEL